MLKLSSLKANNLKCKGKHLIFNIRCFFKRSVMILLRKDFCNFICFNMECDVGFTVHII